MRSPLIFQTLLVCILFFGSDVKAQITYHGFFEGVYPYQIELSKDNLMLDFYVEGEKSQIKFVGQKISGDRYQYEAVDTILTITLVNNKKSLQGNLSNDEGDLIPLKAFLVKDLGVVQTNSKLNLKHWKTGDGHNLSIVNLPGYQVRGVVFFPSLGTSLRVIGTRKGDTLISVIERFGGEVVGSMFTYNYSENTSRCLFEVELEGNAKQYVFELDKLFKLQSKTKEQRVDVIYPVTENKRANRLIEERVDDFWSLLTKEKRTDYGMVWFEPTRFDDLILSGWIHLVKDNGCESYAMNVDLKTGKPIRFKSIVKRKKDRENFKHRIKQAAYNDHPLNKDDQFKEWLDQQGFGAFSILKEGLLFGSSYSPIYGQLHKVISWNELADSNKLPNWLTANLNP